MSSWRRRHFISHIAAFYIFSRVPGASRIAFPFAKCYNCLSTFFYTFPDMEVPFLEHDGHRKRIRERFANDRFESFHPHEMLELLLTYALPRRDTNPIAHRLLDRFGSLHAVLEADIHELTEVDGIGENAATLIAMMVPLARHYEKSKWTEKRVLSNFQEVGKLCTSLFHGVQNEKFYVLSLNSQLELLGIDLVGEGTPNQVPVFPRTVLDALMRRHATGAVLTHNHPGGSPMPSQQDVDVTSTIASILTPLEIRLYDHVLVSDGQPISLKEKGYILFEDTYFSPMAADRQNRILPLGRKKDLT